MFLMKSIVMKFIPRRPQQPMKTQIVISFQKIDFERQSEAQDVINFFEEKIKNNFETFKIDKSDQIFKIDQIVTKRTGFEVKSKGRRIVLEQQNQLNFFRMATPN